MNSSAPAGDTQGSEERFEKFTATNRSLTVAARIGVAGAPVRAATVRERIYCRRRPYPSYNENRQLPRGLSQARSASENQSRVAFVGRRQCADDRQLPLQDLHPAQCAHHG